MVIANVLDSFLEFLNRVSKTLKLLRATAT